MTKREHALVQANLAMNTAASWIRASANMAPLKKFSKRMHELVDQITDLNHDIFKSIKIEDDE